MEIAEAVRIAELCALVTVLCLLVLQVPVPAVSGDLAQNINFFCRLF